MRLALRLLLTYCAAVGARATTYRAMRQWSVLDRRPCVEDLPAPYVTPTLAEDGLNQLYASTENEPVLAQPHSAAAVAAK